MNLLERYHRIRQFSSRIVDPLSPEDCVVQSMPDVSPMRWHLAHTTWFFETFLLKPVSSYHVFDDAFEFLFNSYYNTVGKQFPRSQRGLISRPGLSETIQYRKHVDAAIHELFQDDQLSADQRRVMEIGLHHEQQHQELMLTDIKHVLSCNPLHPRYRRIDPNRENTDREQASREVPPAKPSEWNSFDGGLIQIGHGGEQFCFDNELPNHSVFLQPFDLANRTVSNSQYIEFMEDDGYRRPELWLSMGWATVQAEDWNHPLYWVRQDGVWHYFTMNGLRQVVKDEPVCHVSFFEADAFARWAGCRLPTEFEWEHAVQSNSKKKTSSLYLADAAIESSNSIHPRRPSEGDDIQDALGNVWEWTRSQYSPYPGYQPPPGALGEYNGKFMCNQFVLRGGSCATPDNHIRPTYRNFFPPETRWQFAGFRLARNEQ